MSSVDGGDSLQEPQELQSLVVETKRAWQSLGCVKYGPTKAEQNSLIFRRSIYVAKDIAEGELFTKENLRIVRPGDGLQPQFLAQLLGKSSKRNLPQGKPLKFEDIS